MDGGRYNILTSSDTQTSTLTVLNPMTNDTGDYTCIVNSTSERTIELMEDQGTCKLILLYVLFHL